MDAWYLYMIRTGAGSLYTGISTEPERRLREHAGDGMRGARALRGKGPLALVFQAGFADRAQASRAEYQVKRLAKRDKELLVRGELSLVELLAE